MILMSDTRTFHWIAGNANEYLDFGKAIVESMEQTLSKRRHANNHEKVIFWDIACGSGWMSQYVAASLSDSLSRIVASDIDSMAVRSVRVQKYIAQTTRISRVSLIYITL